MTTRTHSALQTTDGAARPEGEMAQRYAIDEHLDDESYRTVTFPAMQPGEAQDDFAARVAAASEATGLQRSDVTKILGSRQRPTASTAAAVATTDAAALAKSLLDTAQAGGEKPPTLAQDAVAGGRARAYADGLPITAPTPAVPAQQPSGDETLHLRPMTLPVAQVPGDEDFYGDGVFRDYCEQCGRFRNLEHLDGRNICAPCYHEHIDTGLREAVTSFAGQKGLCSDCGEMHGVKKVLLGSRVPRLLCVNCLSQALDNEISKGKLAWESGHRTGRKDAITIIVFTIALAVLVGLLTLTVLAGHM